MTRLIDYTILALAVFRITRLITTDVILMKFRDRIWAKHPVHGNGLGYLITCDWCTSFWVSSPVMIMYKITPEPTLFVCSVLSLSAITGLLNRVS
jgi:hypothetical protein